LAAPGIDNELVHPISPGAEALGLIGLPENRFLDLQFGRKIQIVQFGTAKGSSGVRSRIEVGGFFGHHRLSSA
jgi:hypothetical protein